MERQAGKQATKLEQAIPSRFTMSQISTCRRIIDIRSAPEKERMRAIFVFLETEKDFWSKNCLSFELENVAKPPSRITSWPANFVFLQLRLVFLALNIYVLALKVWKDACK